MARARTYDDIECRLDYLAGRVMKGGAVKKATKAVRYKDSGHEALINVEDFDAAVHEDIPESAPKRGPGRPLKQKDAPKE